MPLLTAPFRGTDKQVMATPVIGLENKVDFRIDDQDV
jgi:hypothetical protein